MSYTWPDETENCKCKGQPMKQFFCPYGHMTECHYPMICEEAECSHYEQQEEQDKEEEIYMPDMPEVKAEKG